MKDPDKDRYQPKRTLGKSPTDLLEEARPQNEAGNPVGEDRAAGLNSAAADAESDEGSGEDSMISGGEVGEENIPTKQIPKPAEETPKKEGYPKWEEDKPRDGEPDEGQTGSSAPESDQT